MKDITGFFKKPNDYRMLSGFLVVAFSGFYLKIGIFSPVYWTALLGLIFFAYMIFAGKTFVLVNDVVIATLAFMGYVLLSQLPRGTNGSLLNVLFSAFYFLLTYEILLSSKKESVLLFCKYLIWISIVLLLVELGWRFTHPALEQPSFYKFKFNSIMYLDSNFVAVFAMCLFFLALYLHENHNVELKKEMIALLILIVLTFSRASILVVAACTILFTKRIPRKWKQMIVVVGCVAAAVLLRIMLNDDSNQMRFYIVQVAIDFYANQSTLAQKLFGIGFGQTQNYIGYGPHLLFITYLLEAGLVGLILLIGYWFVLLKRSRYKAGYVMIPFLIVGFSMAPHFIPYQYCAYAVIMVLESKVECNGTSLKKSNPHMVFKRGV